jgi:hypothetical protein
MQESREVSTPDTQFTKSALTFYIEAAHHALPQRLCLSSLIAVSTTSPTQCACREHNEDLRDG